MLSIVNNTPIKVVQEVILNPSVVALNIFYFETDFVSDQEEQDVVDLLELTMEEFYGALDSEIVSSVELGDMHVYTESLGIWTLVGTGAPTLTATNATDLMPTGVSALLRAYTERATCIGRKYIPGFAEDTYDGDAFISTALTALAVAGVQWVTTREITAGNDLVPGVWSTKTTSIQPMTGDVVVPVVPGYQRRRRPGSGM